MLYLLIDEQRRKNCLEHIAGLGLNRTHAVEIKEYRKNRSTAQNRTMWMWLNAMAPELGYSADDLHEVLKQRFLGLEEKKVSISRNGVVMRELMVRPKSTASLTVGEFSDYLRQVEALAIQMGLRLPYPDDFKFAMTGT
jgi:hypothetical protein